MSEARSPGSSPVTPGVSQKKHNSLEHRNELLAQLLVVFRRRGFAGTTLSELANATGLGKASLYHHFPGGKEEMATELIRLCCHRLNKTAFHFLHQSGSETDRFDAFLKGFSDYVDTGESNCLLAVMSLEGPTGSAAFLRIQTLDWWNQLRRFFRATGCSKKAARRKARDVLARLQGALVMARLTDDPGFFMQTLSDLRRLLPANA